jgi:hypothetical protein
VVSRLDPKAQITSHQQGHWAVRQRSEHAYKTGPPPLSCAARNVRRAAARDAPVSLARGSRR